MPTKNGPNLYLSPGDLVRAIGIDETLLKTDLIREKYQDSHVDGGWSTTFKGDAWDGAAWHLVGEEIPGWVGSTYGEFIKFKYDDVHGDLRSLTEHEIVRVVRKNVKGDKFS